MVERRPTDVDPGPKLRFAAAAIVFDLVSPRGLLNKLLLGLAAPVLPKRSKFKSWNSNHDKLFYLFTSFTRLSVKWNYWNVADVLKIVDKH